MTSDPPETTAGEPLFPAHYRIFARSGNTVAVGCCSWPTEQEAIAFLRGMFSGAGLSRSADRTVTGHIEVWPDRTRRDETVVLHEIATPYPIQDVHRVVDSWRAAAAKKRPGTSGSSPT